MYLGPPGAQSCPTLCDPMDYKIHGVLQARILEQVAFPFSRGIFPTQGSKPGIPHCRWILYQLSHKRSPISRKAQESTVLYSMILWKERRALFSNASKWALSHLIGSWSEFSEPCTFWHGHSQAKNKPRGNCTPSPPFKQKTCVLRMPKEQYW